jgi:hypothetical protein
MVLNVHSNASYLSAPRARSRAGDYFFLGSIPIDCDPIKLNGTIHITCTILKLVAASAAEAKLGALFLNAQEAKVLRLTLKKLGHPQPPTPIHIDNTTTVGIVITLSNVNAPAPRKCIASGCWTGKLKSISNFIINLDRKTWVITLLNTTQPTFINMYVHIMCILIHPLQSSHGH